MDFLSIFTAGVDNISIGGCQAEKVSRKSGISFNAKAQPLESLSKKNYSRVILDYIYKLTFEISAKDSSFPLPEYYSFRPAESEL